MLDLPAGPLAVPSPFSAVSARRGLFAVLAASAVWRLWLGWHTFGFLTGDDVEILEFGFRRALGLDYVPWEIRNTLVSDLLVAPAVWLAHAGGATDVRKLCWIASWPFAALSLVNIALLFAIARRWAGDAAIALLSSALYAVHWLPTGYAATVYPRTASTTCVLGAVALILGERRLEARAAAAGFLLALAFAFRYSEAIFLVPIVLGIATARGEDDGRRHDVARLGALGVGFVAGCLGFLCAYDGAIWGKPLASLAAFAQYLLIDHKSSSLVATQAAGFYLWRLPRWLSPFAWPFLSFARPVARHAASLVALPVLLLSLVHHKELRYLQGVVPFLCFVIAAGAMALWRRGWRRTTVVLCLLTVLWNFAQLRFLGRRSGASVLAAESTARDPRVRTFAATQLWAYGDRLFFGNAVAVRDLPYPRIAPADLERLVPGADRVAIDETALDRDPLLAETLGRLHFCPQARFEWMRGRPVRLFAPCPPEAAAVR